MTTDKSAPVAEPASEPAPLHHIINMRWAYEQACDLADWANANGTTLGNDEKLYQAAIKLRDTLGKATHAAQPVPAPAVDERTPDSGHLAAAPEQQLPEPVAWMHNGYVSKNKGRVLHDEQNNRSCGFKAQPVHALYTADQLRTAIAAERARTADTHAAYCHSQQQFHDAVAELSTLRQQLAEAVRERDALRTQVDAAVPAMRDYARRNPRWESWDNGEVEGKMQDPNGVNAWLEQIDAAIAAQGEANPPGVERELFEGE